MQNSNTYSLELAQIAEEEFQRCLEVTRNSQSSHAPVFGFVTALKLLMIELPRGYSLPDRVVHVCVNDLMQRSQMRGVQYHFSSISSGLMSIGSGESMVLTVDPVTACLQMAGFCSCEETTVLFDFLTRRGNVRKNEFENELEERLSNSGKFKGKTNALWAYAHHRMNTDSSMETRLRLNLEKSGFRDLMVNPVLRDFNGYKYWYLDLVAVDAGMVFEYQGEEWHTSQTSLTNDSEKSLAMQKYGLLPIPVVAAFVQHPYKREDFLHSVRVLRRRRLQTLTIRQKSIFVELFRKPDSSRT